MTNNPYYQFYQGRWWSYEEWRSFLHHNAVNTVITASLYPQYHKKLIERIKKVDFNVLKPDITNKLST